MNWLSALTTMAITAIAGGVCAAAIASALAKRHRVSQFEGAAGFAILGTTIWGVLGGGGLGLLCAFVLADDTSPRFVHGLAASLGAVLGLSLVAFVVGWLTADVPPRIDGAGAILDVEVRLPAGMPRPDPTAVDPLRWHLSLTAMSRGRHQTLEHLRLVEASTRDGAVVLPGSVTLATSDPQCVLGVACGEQGAQFFALGLPRSPAAADLQWSDWLTDPTSLHRTPVPKAAAVAVRYRLRKG